MLVTTDEIKAAWLSPSRQLSIRVTMNDITYGSEDITSLSFDSGSISGEVFQIGSTYMNSVRIIFPSIIETVDEDLEVIPELGVMVNGDFKYTKLGHFFIDEFERNRNSNTTSITATDKMRFMEGKYESKLSYPKSYKEVAIEVANLSGCEINQASFASLGNGSINKPEGYTHRQAIGLIAQFEGGFASFNRNGELEIRRLAPTTFEITPESYMMKGFTKNEVSYRIGGITVKTGDEETDVIRVGSTNGSQVELENKVMTQTLLNHMWDLVKTLNYFPYELKWRGCPPLEAGDWIYVIATDGTKYSVPNLAYSINFSGGMTAESKAATNSSSQATYKYRGTLNQRVDTVESILGSNNWNTNYYDQTEPPYPKEGDIWFKPNGSDTEIWVYKNVNGKLDWVKEISSAPDGSIQQAIDEMQKDLEDSIIVIEQAVKNANQAVAKVDSMDKAVNTALEQSANALDQAQQAIKDANDLLGTVTEVQGTITNISAVVDEINNQIAVKVSQTDFDKLKGTVDTQAGQISANAKEISLKASQSSVDTITDNVTSIQSELKTQAGSITAINTKVEGNITKIGTLESSYSGLSSTIANVKNDFDNLQLGGRNLLLQSSVADRTVISSNDSSKYPIVKTNMTEGSRNFVRVKRSNPTTNPTVLSLFSTLSFTLLSEDIRNAGAITISFCARTQVPSKWTCMAYYFYPQTNAPKKKDLEIDTQWKRFSITFDSIPSEASALRFNPQQVGMDSSINLSEFYLDICEYKVEKGNKRTDWSPAPEDLATITEMSNITQTVKDIQLTVADKVSQAQFTILSNQVTTTVSSINEELAKKKTNRDFKTSNTAASDSKKWTKFAQTRLTKQYDDATVGLDILYNADGGALPKPTTIYIRHKQQAAMGQPTLVEIALTETSEIKAGDLAAVVISSTTSESVVEYYIRNNVGYSVLNFSPFNEVYPDRITYYASQPFLTALPSGVQATIYGVERGNLSEVNKAFSQITQLSDLIDMRVTKGDVIGQITTEAGRVLIGAQSGGTGNYLLVTPDTTYIQNATIKSAHIADASITNAKIANATISSAKIISLDASKITANDLSVITANTGTLNVTGWINVTTENRGIRGTYDFGDGYGEAFNYRWFVGDYRLSHRHLIYTGKIYNVNANNTRGSYLYDGETFFGNDYLKMRQYNASGKLLNRIDINANAITMGAGDWGETSAVKINSDGTGAFTGRVSFNGGIDVAAPTNVGLRVGRIDAPLNYNTITINAERNLTGVSFGIDNIYFNDTRTGSADFRIGKDGIGKVVSSLAIYDRTYGAIAQVGITSNGAIGRITSARKYKADIQIANDVIRDAKKVFEIQPVSWLDKKEVEIGQAINRYYGFIADEFDECGLKEVVIYGADGQVESLAYDRITMYHNVILKEHEKEINQLKKRVSTLENQVRVLQAR